MAQKTQQKTLVSADGSREWTPEDAVQATNLRAQGWTEKPATKAKAAPAASGN
ncbi:hypothetical protein SEA_AOKA_14 [Arthrobacter phage Aoka]|nr:hypothetical protein SEA_AOKA_14 [Arthrobacter phage Aoka]